MRRIFLKSLLVTAVVAAVAYLYTTFPDVKVLQDEKPEIHCVNGTKGSGI